MHPQLPQQRRVPLVPAGKRVVVAKDRQQRLVQPHALGEQPQRPAPQPPGAKRHAGKPATQATAVAVVDRLLAQGDPGLLPQPMAKQGRRVAGHRQHRRGGRLGRVVAARESVRVDPQVHLEGGGRALQGHVVAGQLERVGARDPQVEGVMAQPSQAAVERPVARQVADDPGAQVSSAQRGQNADQHRPAPVRPGRLRDAPKQQPQLLAERREGLAGQQRRGGVQLQVEPVQLQVDAGVGRSRADRLIVLQRPGRAIDQEQLQLGAQRDRTHPEARPLEQLAERR